MVNVRHGGILPKQYKIILSKQAAKYYKRLPIKNARRIDRAFIILEDNKNNF